MSRAARSRLGQRLAGWIFEHMSSALPLRRLRETYTLIAFHHPRPAYPLHILLIPKAARASVIDLTADDSAFMVDLFTTVASMVAEFDLERCGYHLIANGGVYQDVPQLHFHLISQDYRLTVEGR